MTNELGSIRGIGPAALDKLNSAGIDTVNALAATDKETLQEAGFGDSKSSTLLQKARENAVILQTGEDVVEEQENKEYISTGMEHFDDLTGGGWEPGFTYAIYGSTGGGKTQMTFKSMVEAVEQTGLPAVYIETEKDRYRPDRLKELANKDDTQSKIFRIKAYDLEQQARAYDKVAKLPSQNDNIDGFSMVVVDSFTARFRLSDQFESRGDLQSRSKLMGNHLTKLERMAERLSCTILLTCQVYGNPGGYGSAENVYGGSLMQHTVGCFIRMSQSQGDLRKASIHGHPGQKDDDCHIKMVPGDIVSQPST